MPETSKDKVCPKLSGPVFVPKLGVQLHEVKCIEHRCAHYQQIIGMDRNSGEHVAHWDCAFNWHNKLLIENSAEVRQGAAATESLRNENASAARVLIGALSGERVRFAGLMVEKQIGGGSAENDALPPVPAALPEKTVGGGK
jgi:hypothetical protein